jgi:nucleoside-diphosphate-sugar epimerase
MKMLVTGASGFVGRELCRHLCSHGHAVVALVRQQGPALEGVDETRLIGDFYDVDELASAMDGCDVVIHLAGRAHMLQDTAADPLAEFRAVNVGITEALAKAAAAKGISRFIFVSSIGVNGNHSTGRPLTESDLPAPHDLYAISKWEAEQRVAEIANSSDMDFVIARPVLMFGPSAPGNFALLLKLAGKGIPLPFGLLSKRRNLLSVWNFVDFLRTCAEHAGPIRDTFVVADTEAVTLPEIFRYLGEGMNKRQHLLPVPRVLLSTLCAILGKSAVLRKVDAELMVSAEKAARALNWTRPYSAREALVRTGAAYGQEK